MGKRLSFAIVSCLLASLLACGAPPPAPLAAPAPAPAPRALGSLVSLVPVDATLVVVARPTALLASEPTRRVVAAVFSADQLDRFQVRTGVDPRSLDELVVAEHPEGRVVLARGPIDAPFAVREAGERMAPLESSVDDPVVRRAGFLGARRADLSAVAGNTLLWIEGTPQLAAAVLVASRRSEAERDGPLGGSSSEMRTEFDGAPLVVYAPHPLGIPADTGVGLLLAREEAMAAAVTSAEDHLRLRAELRGEFPPGSQDNFRALAESLAASDLGAALGARDALPTLRIQAEDRRVSLWLEVQPRVLASGLRMLLHAEIEELLEVPEQAPTD